MKLLHQIGDRSNGPNFNTLGEILACNEPLSFDGVYKSVYESYKLLKGKNVTFFVTYNYIGKTNAFDVSQPLSDFCTFDEIVEMLDYLNAKLGFHGYAHRRITKDMSDIDIFEEIDPPIFQMGRLACQAYSLAWPYGDYTERAIEIAKRCGYTEAWSAMQGDDANPFAKRRTLLNW